MTGRRLAAVSDRPVWRIWGTRGVRPGRRRRTIGWELAIERELAGRFDRRRLSPRRRSHGWQVAQRGELLGWRRIGRRRGRLTACAVRAVGRELRAVRLFSGVRAAAWVRGTAGVLAITGRTAIGPRVTVGGVVAIGRARPVMRPRRPRRHRPR